jgi:hypothetical protein
LISAKYEMGPRLPFNLAEEGRTQMQSAITFLTVVGGLVFSVAVAVVVEELIFGQVFRVFFAPLPAGMKAEHGRR